MIFTYVELWLLESIVSEWRERYHATEHTEEDEISPEHLAVLEGLSWRLTREVVNIIKGW